MTRVQALILKLLAARPMTAHDLRDEIIKNPECRSVHLYEVLKAISMLCREDLVDLQDPEKAVEESRRAVAAMVAGSIPELHPAIWKITTDGAVLVSVGS